MEPKDFPHWKDPDCQHPAERQRRDGHGTVCLDCGVLQVFG